MDLNIMFYFPAFLSIFNQLSQGEWQFSRNRKWFSFQSVKCTFIHLFLRLKCAKRNQYLLLHFGCPCVPFFLTLHSRTKVLRSSVLLVQCTPPGDDPGIPWRRIEYYVTPCTPGGHPGVPWRRVVYHITPCPPGGDPGIPWRRVVYYVTPCTPGGDLGIPWRRVELLCNSLYSRRWSWYPLEEGRIIM